MFFSYLNGSVGVDTYTILREAVKPANREAFANEVVRYVKDHDLDGVDFDWEYPGAPDLSDIPNGSPDEPASYLKFLQLVTSKLPSNKSLSIAAPASFWYLKQFPIAAISRTVNYIVYMTYDLHGQWDYESPWASDGCPKGSCLRSHVNLTETESSLAMVAKAGVEARKLVVGVSSYGRSFKMSSARCKGPMCTFTGPESGAAKEWADTHNVDSNTDDDEEDLEVIESRSKELSVAVKDYDDKFKWYVDWVKKGIDAALDAFMKVKSGEGNKYIDCEWTAPNSKGSGPCTNVELRVPVNTPKAANRRFITYKMRDEEGFYEALLASHEIEKDWVEWKDNADHDICICPNGPHARDADE
ncbi:Chitinase II [Fusarium oxysporum f. sp. vasinfectum]|nr:Chitinase II [Fusarium oxysporum f. sp. vasinfectum]